MHFPDTIEMSNYVKTKDVPPSSLTYDLSAVLIHRGPSAYSGHYIGINNIFIDFLSHEFNILIIIHFPNIPQHILRTQSLELGTNSMMKLFKSLREQSSCWVKKKIWKVKRH